MYHTYTHTQSDVCKSISCFMAFVHKSVNEMSMQYLANERRYNYTTPKSFLELVRPCLHSCGLILMLCAVIHVLETD